MCVCMSVCMCVCVSVSQAIRLHISQRIFTKCGGNILRVMTRILGYLRIGAFDYFWTDSLQICWEHTMTHPKWQWLRTFHLHALCERVRALVVKHSLIFGWVLFKFAGHILQMTISYMGYVLFMFTHRIHVCVFPGPNSVHQYTSSIVTHIGSLSVDKPVTVTSYTNCGPNKGLNLHVPFQILT
jgi:hypothetical protein